MENSEFPVSGGNQCVYLLRDADGIVRYVGRGSAARPKWSAATKGLTPETVATGLSPAAAGAMEARLINLIGPERLLNSRIHSWRGGGREIYYVTPREVTLVREVPHYYPRGKWIAWAGVSSEERQNTKRVKARESARRSYQTNKSRRKEYGARYYQANKAAIAAKSAARLSAMTEDEKEAWKAKLRERAKRRYHAAHSCPSPAPEPAP